MKLNLRQGLISYQQNFLYFDNTDIFVSTTNKPVIATAAHGVSNYLIVEPVQSPKKLWNNLPVGDISWIYWDLNLITAVKTYGFTIHNPIYSNLTPQSPEMDQHWFNTANNKMFVWNGTSWSEKIRVFAARVEYATIIVPFLAGQSQAGLYGNVPTGVVLFDNFGKAIKKQDGSFLTTEDSLLVDSSVTYSTRIESYTSYGFANESMPAFRVVKSLPENKFALAEYEDTSDEVLSFVVSNATYDQPITLLYEGIITNPDWSWSIGTKLWIDRFGQLTSTDPGVTNILRGTQPPVARAVEPNTILFSPNGGMGSTSSSGGGGSVNIGDASNTDKGVVTLSVAPNNSSFPIAVGTNDPRMTNARTPTAHQHSASEVSITPIVGVTATEVQTALQFIESQVVLHSESSSHLTPSQQTTLNGVVASSAQINSLVGITGSVQTQLNGKQAALGYTPVNRAGDSMTGFLQLPGDPIASSHAATKQYVDSAVGFTGGFLAAPVQNIAALTSIVSTTITDKQIRLVEDEGAIYRYDSQSIETPIGSDVIRPVDNPTLGRWIRIQSTTFNHGTLTGLQGGSAGNYYHVTFNEKTGYDSHLLNAAIHVTTADKNLLNGITVTATEINNLNGTTGPIQTQLDAKQPALGYVPVNKAGDTMTGILTLSGSPVSNLHAATKQYVDGVVVGKADTVHNHDSAYVNVSGDTMTGALTLAGAPSISLHAATKQYVDDLVVASTQPIIGGNGLTKTGNQLDVVGAAGRIVANVDNVDLVQVGTAGTYGLVTTDAYGRVISGSASPSPTITLSGDVSGTGTNSITTTLSNSGVVAGSYSRVTVNSKGLVTSGSNVAITVGDLPIDGYASTYVNVAGDTMTGALTLSGAPSSNLHAATKKYVDDSVSLATGGSLSQATADGLYVNIAGDTMTGALTLSGAPTANLHAATKLYVDTGLTSKSDTTHNHNSLYVSLAGSTMTGALTLSGAPTANLHAATKLYVDSMTTGSLSQATADGLYVNVAGDTMTGALTLSANPTSGLHAATKQYVDNKSRYDIASSTVSTPGSNEVILHFVAVTAFSFGANMAGSRATALIGSAASSEFSLRKNGVQFATMTYVGTTVTFSGVSASFAAGDTFTVVSPASQDATLYGMAYTFAGIL